jgi:hypothetical protein
MGGKERCLQPSCRRYVSVRRSGMTRRSVMLRFIVAISDLLLISNKQPQRLVLLGLRERHRLQAPYRTAAQSGSTPTAANQLDCMKRRTSRRAVDVVGVDPPSVFSLVGFIREPARSLKAPGVEVLEQGEALPRARHRRDVAVRLGAPRRREPTPRGARALSSPHAPSPAARSLRGRRRTAAAARQ